MNTMDTMDIVEIVSEKIQEIAKSLQVGDEFVITGSQIFEWASIDFKKDDYGGMSGLSKIVQHARNNIDRPTIATKFHSHDEDHPENAKFGFFIKPHPNDEMRVLLMKQIEQAQKLISQATIALNNLDNHQ